MDFSLRPLPYPAHALEPVIGRHTVQIHHQEHHRGYLEKLKRTTWDTPEAALELSSLVRVTEGAAFENAAQVWNHDFYWRSLTPGGSSPSRTLARVIEDDFGSFDKLRDTFLTKGADHFGSGWVWLVARGTRLEVVDTHDADTPLAQGLVPLLGVDVWEHAYYLEYRGNRTSYLEQVFDGLLDWQFAERNLRGDTRDV